MRTPKHWTAQRTAQPQAWRAAAPDQIWALNISVQDGRRVGMEVQHALAGIQHLRQVWWCQYYLKLEA